MFNDMSCSSMHARASTDICVELCEEDKTEKGDEHRCGQLMQSKCGTGAIAHDWQAELTRTLKDLGFKQGRASPCVLCHRQKDIKTMVHRDDFVSSRERSELEWLCRSLQTFATKMKMKGQDDDLDKEAEPNREVAPAPGNRRRCRSQACGNNQS